MNERQWRDFVTAGTKTGTLAVTRLDGRPHVTPVWFLLDGDDIVLTTHQDGVKGKALRRDPRAALCVDDQQPQYSFVVIEGHVRISDDLDEVRRWSAALGGRYMGAERAEEFGARNGVPGELLVRLRAEKVIAVRDVTG